MSARHLDPGRQLCRFEQSGGICADSSCHDLHFRDLEPTGNVLFLFLSSLAWRLTSSFSLGYARTAVHQLTRFRFSFRVGLGLMLTVLRFKTDDELATFLLGIFESSGETLDAVKTVVRAAREAEKPGTYQDVAQRAATLLHSRR